MVAPLEDGEVIKTLLDVVELSIKIQLETRAPRDDSDRLFSESGSSSGASQLNLTQENLIEKLQNNRSYLFIS